MAVSQIDAASQLGKFLQIVYSNGIRNQISEDFRDWEMVSKFKVSDEAARSVNFLLQTSLGANAVQWSAQGSGAAFPSSQKIDSGEKSAGFNEIFTTIELEYDLWDRAMNSPHKYAGPLETEIRSKGIAQKRRLSIDFHGDGTGLISTAASASVVNTTQIKVVLSDESGERICEYGDLVAFFAQTGGSTVNVNGVLNYGQVVEKLREENAIVIAPFTAADVALTAGEAATAAAALSSSDYMYRRDQPTKADLTTAFNGSNEVNNLTEVMPGLESLAASDGRLVHGIVMSGASAGTSFDASSELLDISHIQKAMSKVKNVVGQGRYKYQQLLGSTESMDTFIDSQETDRRLISINDEKRGAKGFGYVHGNDTLLLETSEFARHDRLWMLPAGAKESGVLELHGKDFKEVKVDGQSTYLKPSSGGGHTPDIRKYMFGVMTLLTKHPAAINQIKNFTNNA